MTKSTGKRGPRKSVVVLAEPGERLGDWTLVEHRGMAAGGQLWLVRCLCGTERVACLPQLRFNVRRGNGYCKKCSRRLRQSTRASGFRMLVGHLGREHAFQLVDGPMSGDVDDIETLVDVLPRGEK